MELNRKTVTIGAAVAALAAGGVGIAYAVSGDSEEQATGPQAEKAKQAALKAVGGGTVTGVEREDGDGDGTFEVEVERADGSQVEVHVGSDFGVVGQQSDDDGSNDEDGPGEDD